MASVQSIPAMQQLTAILYQNVCFVSKKEIFQGKDSDIGHNYTLNKLIDNNFASL
tara:strand:+ start:221 stop:385 length:165 start_codon:yes stop_codon:yes gene_type:complete